MFLLNTIVIVEFGKQKSVANVCQCLKFKPC